MGWRPRDTNASGENEDCRTWLTLKHNEQVTTGKFDTVKETNSGFLVLTSQRLVWFERHGFMSKQVRPTLTFDLLAIQGIAKGGKLATCVSIAHNSQERLFHFGRWSDEDFLQKFKGSILQAAYRLKQKLEQARTTNAVVRTGYGKGSGRNDPM